MTTEKKAPEVGNRSQEIGKKMKNSTRDTCDRVKRKMHVQEDYMTKMPSEAASGENIPSDRRPS